MAESAWDQAMNMFKKPKDKAAVPASPAPKPSPDMLGTGMAQKAGDALKNRKSKIDQAIDDAGG